jgi:hypothetical protein
VAVVVVVAVTTVVPVGTVFTPEMTVAMVEVLKKNELACRRVERMSF